MKVLLVDDHPLILSALQTVIKGLGDDVSVLGAASAAEARAALKQDPDFDLTLLDLSLGDADGFVSATRVSSAISRAAFNPYRTPLVTFPDPIPKITTPMNAPSSICSKPSLWT